MRYMLMTHVPGRPEAGNPDAEAAYSAVAAFHERAVAEGALVSSDPLADPASAVTVRVQDSGEPLVTDGPFAETKEWLGGYFVLECADLDEALDWAAAFPTAAVAPIEVRPVVERPGARAGEPDGPSDYMLLIHDDPDGLGAVPEDERAAISAEYLAVAGAPGVTGGAQLHPASTATLVQVRDGERIVTDGPFTETKEQVGGYYLVHGDRDTAVGLAARIPAARMGGAIEVRPVLGR